ncbi:MAG: hypothetical protein IK147_01015 [Clostridia bacterium]|nr:hypothetical protein [Clostridia bacterium]
MSNGRKITVIIAIAFFIALIASIFTLFSVKKVSAEYDVYGDAEETAEIQRVLDGFKGKNALFFDTDEIKESLSGFSYYEVISVEKQYPNVISVSLKKRTETFSVAFGDKTYVLSEEGIILNDVGAILPESRVVDVSAQGITVENAVSGERIATSDDALFYSALKIAGKAAFSDFVLSVGIVSEVEIKDVVLNTRTGVKITVYKADTEGQAKIETALAAFENASDYVKTYSEIVVYKADTGEIKVDWLNGPSQQ